MNPTPTAPPHALGASLRRSSDDRLLLGLCSGVARATGSNVTAVRLGTWALAVILLPVVLLGYLVTALIVPRDDGATLIGPGERDRRDVVTAILATLLAAPVVLGAADGSLITTGRSFPALSIGTIVIGIALIANRRRDRQPTPVTSDRPSEPVASDPFSGTLSGPYVDETRTMAADAPHHTTTSEEPTRVGLTKTAAHAAAADAADPSDTAVQGSPARPSADDPSERPTFVSPGGLPRDPATGAPYGQGGPQEPRRRGLAMPVLSTLALIPALFAVLIAVSLVDSNTSSWAVMLGLMAVASAAGAVAIALLRPSYLGAGLLVILAASFGALSISFNQLGPVLDDGIGERTFRPTAVDELRRPYLLGVGELTVDLRDLELARGSRTTVDATLGFGHLRIVVPAGVRVVAAPGSELPGLTAGARRTGASDGASAGAPTIALDIDVRGAQVDLLAGPERDVDTMTPIESISSGFWGTDENAAVDPPTPADSLQGVTTP